MLKKSKRFLAGFLAFLLVVTMVPTDMLSVVYAAGASLEASMITFKDGKDSFVYTGEAIRPDVTVTANGEDVASGDTTYGVGYQNNTNAGTGKVIITPASATETDDTVIYGTAVEKEFTIEPATITEVTLTADSVKEGEAAPAIKSVKAGELTLSSGDYEVAYSVDGSSVEASALTGVEAGKTVTVTVTATEGGNFKDGSSAVTASYTVTKAEPTAKDLAADGKGTIEVTEKTAGAAPTVKVSYDGTEITETSQYTVKYYTVTGEVGSEAKDTEITEWGGIAADTKVWVEVTGDGTNYTGTIHVVYTTTEAGGGDNKTELTTANTTVEAEGVAGAEPTVTVKYNGAELTKGTDYTVTYKKGDVSIEVADIAKDDEITVVVTGTGDYKGEVTGKYTATEATVPAEKENYVLDFSKYDATKSPNPGDLKGKFGIVAGNVKVSTYGAIANLNAASLEGWSYTNNSTNVYKLDGNTYGSKSNQAITFTPAKNVTIKIGAFPGQANVNLVIWKGEDSYTSDLTDSSVVGSKEYVTSKSFEEASFKLTGDGKTKYGIGTNNSKLCIGYIIVEEDVSESAVDLATITPTLSAATVAYTGDKVTPPIVTIPGVDAADYTVKYARKTGDSDPADADYKELADAELVELGIISVKAFAKTSGYKNATKAVTFEIVKGAAPTVDKKEIPVNISTATDEQKTAGSMPQEINLSSEFSFDSKYGTPEFKNARVDDPADAANNVLATTPDVKVENGVLKFNSKAALPEGDQVAATIKVDVEFEKYETVTLIIEVTLASKEIVTISGVTVANKTYDGVAVAPNVDEISIKEGSNELKDTLANQLVYTYAVKNGVSLGTDAPKNAGTYTLVVSVAPSNSTYSGTSASIEFTIAPKTIKIKAVNKEWDKLIQNHPEAGEAKAADFEYVAVNEEPEEDKGLVTGDALTTPPSLSYYKTADAESPLTDDEWKALAVGDKVVIKISGAAAGDNYSIEYAAGELTVAASDVDTSMTVVPKTGAVLLSSSFNALTDKTEMKIETPTRYADDHIMITGSAAYPVTVDYINTSNKTPRIKTGGAGNQCYRSFGFKISEAAEVEIECTSSGSDARKLVVASLNEDNTVTECVGAKYTIGTAAEQTYNETDKLNVATGDASVIKVKLSSEGTYYIYSSAGGINFTKIAVSYPNTDPGDEVTINATITDTNNLLGSAKVYFTASGKTDVEAGSAAKLEKNVTYKLVVKNADGSESDTLEAKINGLLSYTPTDDDTVTIVISNKGEEPPVETAKITPTISDPDKKLGEASVYFVTTDKTDKVRVIDGKEVELVIGTEYRLVVMDQPEGINLKATINDSDVYKVTGNANVTITIAEVPVVKYKVTLADETGKAIKTEEIEEGKEFTFPDTENKKDGYFFAGWTPEGEERAFGKGETIVVEYDITFRETWVQAGKEDVTVKFYDYYENELPNLAKTIKAGESPVITLPEAASKRVGYVFRGWYDSEYGNLYTAGASYTVTKNVSFYESWEEEELPETGMVVRIDEEEAYYQGGKAVTPYVYVYYKGNELSLGTDYTVKYKNNKNAGTATVTVTGKGNYAKAVKKDISFTIRPRNVDYLEYADEMTVIKDAKFTPVILCNGKVLKAGKDYDLSDETTKVEDGKEVKADTGFDAAKCRYTKVTDKAVTDDKGEVTTPAKYNTLVLKGKGNYTGTAEIYVTVIDKSEAKSLGVEIDKTFKPTYGDNITWGELFGENQTTEDGKKEFKVGKVKVFDKKDSAKAALERNKDFMVVDVSGDINSAGTYKFMVVGMGVYSGSVTKTIKVSPKKSTDIKAGVLDSEKNEWYYWNTDKEPVFLAKPTAVYNNSKAGVGLYDLTVVIKVTEKDSDGKDVTRWQALYNGWDYKVSYSGNKKVGDAKAKITFINNYKGTAPITVDYAITGDTLNYTYVKVPDMTYTKPGKAYKSKPLVEYNGAILKAAEYEAHYEWVSASKYGTTDDKGNDTTAWTPDDKVKITLEGADTYAVVRVTITPNSKKSNFVLAKDAEGKDRAFYAYYYVRKADNAIDLSKAKVTFYSDPEFKTQYKKIPFRDVEFWTPDGNEKLEEEDESAVYVKVEVNGKTVDAKLYDVTWLCASNKGKATVVITGNGPSDTETTVTPVPTLDENPQAEESSEVDGSGSSTSTSTGATYAVGGKTVTVAIDSIGGWIEPKKAAEKAMNFLKKLF